jgi:hypothetical protein
MTKIRLSFAAGFMVLEALFTVTACTAPLVPERLLALTTALFSLGGVLACLVRAKQQGAKL